MVVYHHDDIDGIAAAAISANKTQDIENVTYKKFSYGDEFNSHSNGLDGVKEDVVFLDISFSEDKLDQLIEVCNEAKTVIWIDHHATSIDFVDKYKDELQKIKNLTYFIDDNYCGAFLTYIFLNIPVKDILKVRDIDSNEYYDIQTLESRSGDRVVVQLLKYSKNTLEVSIEHEIEIPKWLIYVDDYDCWKKKDKNSNYFQLGIMSEPNYDVTYYDEKTERVVLNTLWTNIINLREDANIWVEKGKIVYNYLMKRYKDEFGMTFIWNYDGKEFLCKNGTGNSYNFLDESKKYAATILFAYDGASGMWKYSIYSDNESGIDCKKFAEMYGGGGHIHASGFSTKELIFIKDNPVVSELGIFRNVRFK